MAVCSFRHQKRCYKFGKGFRKEHQKSPEVNKVHFTVRLFEKRSSFPKFKANDLMSFSRELPEDGTIDLSFV